MTNEQLYVYLKALSRNLEIVYAECEEKMPEDAPREKIGNYRLKPEFKGEFHLIWTENMKEYYTTDGDYLALNPLKFMIRAMEEGIDILKT